MGFGEAKRYYVQRRVDERMAASASIDFPSYFARLRSDVNGEVEQFVNAFTVNETYFYREDHQLACLTADLLPERIRNRRRSDAVRREHCDAPSDALYPMRLRVRTLPNVVRAS